MNKRTKAGTRGPLSRPRHTLDLNASGITGWRLDSRRREKHFHAFARALRSFSLPAIFPVGVERDARTGVLGKNFFGAQTELGFDVKVQFRGIPPDHAVGVQAGLHRRFARPIEIDRTLKNGSLAK